MLSHSIILSVSRVPLLTILILISLDTLDLSLSIISLYSKGSPPPSLTSSKLGSKNCASYGIRDDEIVDVTISFGKTADGYLYQKTIPFGKAINVNEIKNGDSTNSDTDL